MKRTLVTLSVIAIVVTLGGCAITDYSGYAGHKTSGEAKLWGLEISYDAGPNDPLTGTYSYTAKYDNRNGQGTVTINSYKNDVVSSFSREGSIDRDGDDVQGNQGSLGGTFLPFWRAVDTTGGGSCEFTNNITFAKNGLAPIVASCYLVEEEVDADFDLHADFADLGSFLAHLWSSRGQATTLSLESLDLNGVNVPLQPISVGMVSAGRGPIRFTVDGNTAAFDALLQGILDNTEHMAPVTLNLNFSGGMSVGTPAGLVVAFNHDGIVAALNR